MNRDPFYQDILTRLCRPLDPELFERCANALLLPDLPGIAPIRGGGDAGMDGAIPDAQGPAYPLICTTAGDVIGNITWSLKSYLKNGGQRRTAVVATSQELTPLRRRHIENRARELGFTLVQIFTQSAIADRLYRRPDWCLELLNLSGDPPALSIVPLTSRLLVGDVLIGRADDLGWLHETSGDILLVGHPGCGKTFLLHQFVKEGGGLFVVSEDRRAIAAALRSQSPSAVLVDDAHVRTEILVSLRQMRAELGAEFRIIATSWPGECENVAQALSVSTAHVRTLELLTRDEIVEVIRGAGLGGPTDLIREIVDQAEGRPGLAGTLAHLCLRGGARDVALGEALSQSVRTSLQSLVGAPDVDLLAHFGLGGDGGMSMQAVAQALEQPLVTVRQSVVQLAASGVLTEARGDRLSVRPTALRFSLVRDVFFGGPASLPHEPLLGQVDSLQDVAETLIGARSRGARIPFDKLSSILKAAGSDRAWAMFAGLGPQEAAYVATQYPKVVLSRPAPALYHVPERAIPILLNAAVSDDRPLHSYPDHPLRLLQDWIHHCHPRTEEPIRRREVLIRAVSDWVRQDTAQVGINAVALALSPTFEILETDPGQGMRMALTRGLLSTGALREFPKLWKDALLVVNSLNVSSWDSLLQVVERWCVAEGPSGNEAPPEVQDAMHSVARQMLEDMAPLLSGRHGPLQWIKRLAPTAEAALDLQMDPDFEVLFPGRDRAADFRAAEAQQQAAVHSLAERWAKSSADWVAGRIMGLEQEALSSAWPRWTPYLCQELARRVPSRSAWVRAFLTAAADGELVEPYLTHAVSNQESGWETLWEECLENPSTRRSALAVMLTRPDAPSGCLEKACARLEGASDLVEILCLRGQVPEGTLRCLLDHKDPEIASQAANGVWNADPEGSVPEELRIVWREALFRAPASNHWLGDILRTDPQLAGEWLQQRLATGGDNSGELWAADQTALGSLTPEARSALLPSVPPNHWGKEFVRLLVGDSTELYQQLLANPELAEFHLAPVETFKEGSWEVLAQMALDAGYSPKEIGARIPYYPSTFGGNESELWQGWITRLTVLKAHEDSRIRQIAEVGLEFVQREFAYALARERREAVFGLFC